MNSNEEIVSSICYRIMVVCNRINKRLDENDKFHSSYDGHPNLALPYVTSRCPQTRHQPWQTEYNATDHCVGELRVFSPPEPDPPYGPPLFEPQEPLPLRMQHYTDQQTSIKQQLSNAEYPTWMTGYHQPSSSWLDLPQQLTDKHPPYANHMNSRTSPRIRLTLVRISTHSRNIPPMDTTHGNRSTSPHVRIAAWIHTLDLVIYISIIPIAACTPNLAADTTTATAERLLLSSVAAYYCPAATAARDSSIIGL